MLEESKTVPRVIGVDGMNQCFLSHGCTLSKQLHSLEFEQKWVIISEVWTEMLFYAATHCEWKEHAQQLRKGGELLTHVCLLMNHPGVNLALSPDTF